MVSKRVVKYDTCCCKLEIIASALDICAVRVAWRVLRAAVLSEIFVARFESDVVRDRLVWARAPVVESLALLRILLADSRNPPPVSEPRKVITPAVELDDTWLNTE